MAAIVKYMDNIARVYAHSMSMIITIMVSSIWLQRLPSIQFIFGSIIVLVSLHLYHLPHTHYHHRGHHHADDKPDDKEPVAVPDHPYPRRHLPPHLHDDLGSETRLREDPLV